jgi:hypothetical protein
MIGNASRRTSARIAIIKLRSFLATDTHIPLQQRQELIDQASDLIEDDKVASKFRAELLELIKLRFGRNPDTYEVSNATDEALRLLDAVQAGRLK